MQIDTLIDELQKVKDRYGNIDVTTFNQMSYENNIVKDVEVDKYFCDGYNYYHPDSKPIRYGTIAKNKLTFQYRVLLR